MPPTVAAADHGGLEQELEEHGGSAPRDYSESSPSPLRRPRAWVAPASSSPAPDDAGAPTAPAKHVLAQLHYLSSNCPSSPTNPPIQVVTRGSTTRDPRTTVKIAAGPAETIHDVRGSEASFTLGENGFAFLRRPARFAEWESREGIWSEYVRELVGVVGESMGGVEGGVDEIIAFHEGKRGSNKSWLQAADGQRTNPFARQVHVDQTGPTIRKLVNEKTDIKGDWLWKGRVRQVNAWRPLYHPVYDCGLCVADAQTVVPEDLIECHRIRERDGAFLDTMGVVKYREGRKWYYKSEMEPEDVVLFMGFDSDCVRGVRKGTGFTLHSAFDIPDPPAGAPPRASIEVRLLVFTWPKEPLVIRPGLGMLTTTAPPRSEMAYESHHTGDLEVVEEEEEVEEVEEAALAKRNVVKLWDEKGVVVDIDLNDVDPIDAETLSRCDSLISVSPSPKRKGSRAGRRSSSISLEEDVTADQVLALTEARISDLQQQMEQLQRQMDAVRKTKEMVLDPVCKARMVRVMNERRRDERGRQRLELARRIRMSMGDEFFDL